MLKTALVTLATVAAMNTTQPAGPVYSLSGDYEISVTVGVCYTAAGAGAVIYETDGEIDPDYDYISYSGTTAVPGDIVLTVDVLTAGSVDDVIFRDDYIIESIDAAALNDFIVERYNEKSEDAKKWMLDRLTE